MFFPRMYCMNVFSQTCDIRKAFATYLAYKCLSSFLMTWNKLEKYFVSKILLTYCENNFVLKSIHPLKQCFPFYENKVLQLMSAGASLEKFGEKDLVFIKWRSCTHFFKNEWTLVIQNFLKLKEQTVKGQKSSFLA